MVGPVFVLVAMGVGGWSVWRKCGVQIGDSELI